MGAAEGWPLIAVGWLVGFGAALVLHVRNGSEPTGDVLWHAAVTSGSAALVLLAVFPWAAAIVARGSIASLLKDR